MSGYEYLVNFLDEEGFEYEQIGDNTYEFKFHGVNYYFLKGEGTPYLQICLDCKSDGKHTREELLEILNRMNQLKYVVKFTLDDCTDSIVASYELAPNASTTSADFMHILGVLNRNSDEFFKKLKAN